MAGSVSLEVAGPVATVTLSNAGKLNAMTRAMWGELRWVFEELQRSSTVRCVVMRGHGGEFCAGGDIAEYAGFRFEEASLRDFHEGDVWGGLSAMLACDLPMIARIEGNCMGAGLEIACCCDLRIASEDARFGAPIARLGFPMAPREAALVMGVAGELTARELLLSAAVLEAVEMKQRGFLNAVCLPGSLDGSVAAHASRIARLAPAAARMNKQTLRALLAYPKGMDAAASVPGAYAYAPSDEHREGVAAFVEKRAPAFAR